MPGQYLVDQYGNPITDTNPLPTSLTGRNALDAQALWTPGMLNNGTTNDMPRGNTQGTLLVSAARTGTITSPTQTNYNARGVQIILNVTVASGTGGLQVTARGIDPISGSQYLLNTQPAAVIATGIYVYEIYPTSSATGSVTQRTSGALPRTWTVTVAHNDVTSYTYSLGYALIV